MFNFALAIFLGAFLIFQVQPFIGKYILPWFGGTPAVWSTCMLFFQTLLLGGYLYAHWNATCLRPKRQALVHSGLLLFAIAAILLQWFFWGTPILPDVSFKPDDSTQPTLRLLVLLIASVGLPYFILSATGPLAQAWFNRIHPERSPYRLYMLSNIGSLLALVTYPFIFEPLLKLKLQADLWAWCYALFAGTMAICAYRLWRHSAAIEAAPPAQAETKGGESPETGQAVAPPTWRTKLLWLGLAATASAMLLASTNQMCQEVAVIPFLWVLPLTLYLLSFIIVFAGDNWYSRKWWGIIYLIATVLAIAALFEGFSLFIVAQVVVYSFVLFALCMVCHGELVRLRPHPSYLTSFYLMMSAGGAIGGAFVSLLAPILFHGFWELHISIWLGWALFLIVLWREKGSWLSQPGLVALKKALAGLLVILAAVLYGHTRKAGSDAVHCERNFYGVLRVRQKDWDDSKDKAYKLSHGAITHGFQYLAPNRRHEPASYYADNSGVSLALAHYPAYLEAKTNRKNIRVGVVGLGVGTLATFGRQGDYYRFYEINPSVTDLSQGENAYFTYLKDADCALEVVDGDARISMERELRNNQPQNFDVLAIDAFSSDSIPAHLLTREALKLYVQHMAPGGVVAVHISNRHLDLRPVVTCLAALEGLAAAIISSEGDDKGRWSSTWVLLTHDKEFLELPVIAKATSDEGYFHGFDIWTDDYSNMYQLLY